MQQEDREQRMDDDGTARSRQDDPHAPQAPVVRLLANPRRVRRA